MLDDNEHAIPPVPPVPPVPESALVTTATGYDRILFTPSKIRSTYQEKLAEGQVTEEQISQIIWLLGVGKSEILSIRELGVRTKIDGTTLHKIFSGSYGAKIDAICERIESFRALYLQRLAITKADFVETSLVKKIWKVCDTALLYQTIFPIYGDSQTGKTEALMRYRDEHNHGRTVYVRMPAGGAITAFLVALNRALLENDHTSGLLLRQRPMEVLSDQNLLIIDEIHQTTINPGYSTARVTTIEYIRELWDRTKCGLVVCGTNAFRDEVEAGRNKALLEQFRRRGMKALQLPAILPASDLDKIAAAYDLPKAEGKALELRLQIVRSTGLRAYTNLLKAASKYAEKKGKAIDWCHFISAHDVFSKLDLSSGAEDTK